LPITCNLIIAVNLKCRTGNIVKLEKWARNSSAQQSR
jgi:hypothetical protein